MPIAKRVAVVLLLIIAATGAGAVKCWADRVGSIKERAALVEKTAHQWMNDGKDPSRALTYMHMAAKEFDKGNADGGEALVKKAMGVLDLPGGTAPAADDIAPRGPREPASDLYRDPQRITLSGYSKDAMEPCISLDGQYLFFNNSNEVKDTHLYYAKRVSDTEFKYLGPLPGTRITSPDAPPADNDREMAPTMDSSNQFYFSATRSYPRDRRTLYVGKWMPEKVSAIDCIAGDISPRLDQWSPQSWWINMDSGVSPDGKTLVFSRAQYKAKVGVVASDLLAAQRVSSHEFVLDPQSAAILKRVNSAELEYAPALTDDHLELYFTRARSAEAIATKSADTPLVRIMVARRTSPEAPFGAPQHLTAAQGFVEAPSLTLDKKEMFFHKMDGGKFRIWRMRRQSKLQQSN